MVNSNFSVKGVNFFQYIHKYYHLKKETFT